MHPNHPHVDQWSTTWSTCPFRRGTSLGRCDWVVKIFFAVPTFNCNPTSAKHVTNSSNKNFVASNVLAKRISLTPQRAKTTEDSIHILVAPLPWYKANLHQHCCVQSAMSGHNTYIAKPITYDQTFHVRLGFPIRFPIWPCQVPCTNQNFTSNERVLSSTRFVVSSVLRCVYRLGIHGVLPVVPRPKLPPFYPPGQVRSARERARAQNAPTPHGILYIIKSGVKGRRPLHRGHRQRATNVGGQPTSSRYNFGITAHRNRGAKATRRDLCRSSLTRRRAE